MSVRKIVLTADSCDSCPFTDYEGAGVTRCAKASREIPKDGHIPPWCPLPDMPIITEPVVFSQTCSRCQQEINEQRRNEAEFQPKRRRRVNYG